MHKRWNDEHLDRLIKETLERRLEPAGSFRRDVQWQRLRERLDAQREGKRIRLGPWAVPRVGLAACGLLLMVLLVPLALSNLTDFGRPPAQPLALTEETAPPREEATEDAELMPDVSGDEPAQNGPRALGADGAPDGAGGLAFDNGDQPDTAPGEPGADPDGMDMASITVAEAEPPPTVQEGLTLDEVQRTVPFQVRFPRHLPPEFTMVDITYEPHTADSGKVILYFDHPDGRYLRIEQELPAGPAEPAPALTEATEQTTTVRNRAAKLVIREDDWCELYWKEGRTVFKMWGQVSPKEMKEVAESLFDSSPAQEP